MALDVRPGTMTYDAEKKDLYAMGELPPLGHVPAKMHAWVLRQERHGTPDKALQLEVVDTPTIDSHEVLVLVMAAGVNYNGVWACLGQPASVFRGHKAPYAVIGSDAAGVVWAVGEKVTRWKVGDEVVVHCNQDDGDDEECNGGDPMLSPSQRIWGYESADGSFAQFTRVQAQQLMARPKHLTWEESGCYTLTLATAYRMLFGHPPHDLQPGQNVLVWGASGGLGSFAIQLINTAGANAIGVISDESKRDFVMSLGAKGVQGDLGHHRQGRERRHGVRASGRIDLPRLDIRGEARRHGGDLRRHHGLQLHLRRAPHVEPPEAASGQPLRPSQAGERGQQADARASARPLYVRGVRVARPAARPHEDAEERTQAGQHVGAGAGATHRAAHDRGRPRGRPVALRPDPGMRRKARPRAGPRHFWGIRSREYRDAGITC